MSTIEKDNVISRKPFDLQEAIVLLDVYLSFYKKGAANTMSSKIARNGLERWPSRVDTKLMTLFAARWKSRIDYAVLAIFLRVWNHYQLRERKCSERLLSYIEKVRLNTGDC